MDDDAREGKEEGEGEEGEGKRKQKERTLDEFSRQVTEQRTVETDHEMVMGQRGELWVGGEGGEGEGEDAGEEEGVANRRVRHA